MSAWNKDIEEYAHSRNKEPAKVQGILQRDGWDESNYKSSMKKALFEWLDQWYTLSIKNLPTPATALRRNPVIRSENYRRVTRLPHGWSVLTYLSEGVYYTQVLNKGQHYAEINSTKEDADLMHTQLVKKVLHDQN